MRYTTLIDAKTLARQLNSGWCIFDCRFALSDPSAGERAYAAGHIPGARYLHLDRDLASPVTPASGRHPLPDAEILAAKLAGAGVGADTQVVAYDDAAGAFAARLWWLLRWLGHPQVAVLDGGWAEWLREGRPVSHEPPPESARGNFRARPDDRKWLSSGSVLRRVHAGIGRLLDARAAERFRGEQEPIDAVAGHVPSAVNLPYLGNISGNGRFQSAETLRTRFLAAFAGAASGETVCMCGSGVTACHNLLAMEVAGLSGGRLYAGSWSEWIRDPSRPVARGPW
ncbi:MAG TPA: sulfurtransferase [Gammaproteobacteria bacterium]|nr:sulfurtransferase [Gammaproteobacteria bacterium]